MTDGPMNGTVRGHAIKEARGDVELAADWVQEAEIAWWLKGMHAMAPQGKSRWGCRFVSNLARTHWRIDAERRRVLRANALLLIPSDDPVFLVPAPPTETYRQRENRQRNERMSDKSYRDNYNRRQRERYAAQRAAYLETRRT